MNLIQAHKATYLGRDDSIWTMQARVPERRARIVTVKLPWSRIDGEKYESRLRVCGRGNKNKCGAFCFLRQYLQSKGVGQNARFANIFQGPTNDSKVVCVSNPY